MELTLVGLVDAFRLGTVSPVEYWEHVERRIDAIEPRINALYLYDPEAARRAAVASEARWHRGRPAGPLDGVPVTVKELIATAGDPIPMGSASTILTPATADAPVAARLKESGAVLFAKTTAPDLAMLSSGLSSFHRLTRNPWDPTKNPGGSSAGAAAATAAGFGPLHIGTDIGGSVRLPAAWCGVVGFKPSLGRVPVDPYYTGRCAGPMTRSVADAAYAMQVLALPDPRDATSLPPFDGDWMDLGGELAGLRIGLMLEAGCGMPLENEIHLAILEAARLFELAGAVVRPVPPVMTRRMLDGIDDFWRARAWNDLLRLPEERRLLTHPMVYRWAASGAEIPGHRVVEGFNQSFEMRRAAAELFGRVDVLLSPTTPVVSFPAEHASPLDDPKRPFEHIAYTLPWNMSEQPAISLNCGFSGSGMPIGLQLVGPRFGDLRLLQIAYAYEALRGPMQAALG